MKSIFIFFTVLSVQCYGLQINYIHGPSSESTPRQSCGVLTCTEEIRYLDTTYATDLSQNITGLSIYKGNQSSQNSETDKEPLLEVASLNLSKLYMTKDSDTFHVDGYLTSEQAILRLELYTDSECEAVFTCQSRIVDQQDNERIDTIVSYHLEKQGKSLGDDDAENRETTKGLSNSTISPTPNETGLQINYFHGPSSESSPRQSCGVLTCTEEIRYLDTTYGTDLSQNITGLSIYKSNQSSQSSETDSESLLEVASLNLSKLYITKDSDTFHVDGYLTSEQAILRLELYTDSECEAVFTCQSRVVDQQGNERVDTIVSYHLEKQGLSLVDDNSENRETSKELSTNTISPMGKGTTSYQTSSHFDTQSSTLWETSTNRPEDKSTALLSDNYEPQESFNTTSSSESSVSTINVSESEVKTTPRPSHGDNDSTDSMTTQVTVPSDLSKELEVVDDDDAVRIIFPPFGDDDNNENLNGSVPPSTVTSSHSDSQSATIRTSTNKPEDKSTALLSDNYKAQESFNTSQSIIPKASSSETSASTITVSESEVKSTSRPSLATVPENNNTKFVTVSKTLEDNPAKSTIFSYTPNAKNTTSVWTSETAIETKDDTDILRLKQSEWIPEMTVHILSLVEKLYNKFVSIEGWENKLNKLESKFVNLEMHLGNKVDNVQNRLESLENRTEEKILRLEDKVQAKTGKLSSLALDSETFAATLRDDLAQFREECAINIVDAFKQDVTVEIINSKTHFTNYLEHEINKAASLLISAGINLSASPNCVAMSEISNDELAGESSQINSDIMSVKISLRRDLEKILNLTSEACHTSRDFGDFISQTFESALEALVRPSSCYKGMVTIPSQSLFPYPVIYPKKEDTIKVPYMCDTHTEGGGWIPIHRRSTGNTEFYREWEDYKRGFGSFDDDFWLGLETVHELTKKGEFELWVELKTDSHSAFAHYDYFYITNEEGNYTLQLGNYTSLGSAGDSMDEQRGMQFTTKDKDNDLNPSGNCASKHRGAWWYNHCSDANLNGKWGEKNGLGMEWETFSGDNPITFAEMKIRRKS